MKKKILTVISVFIIVVLLATLCTLGYVIYDQISNFGVSRGSKDEKDDKEVTTEIVSETASLTAPDETTVFDAPEFDFTVAEPEVTAPAESELVSEKVYDDGSKEIFNFNENGELVKHVFYNASGKIELINLYTAESVTTTNYFYDENGEMTSGAQYVLHLTGDEIYEEHTLNRYGGVTFSKYVDKNGATLLTRTHHFNAAGYRDGYTETDKDGNSVRYNDDGTIRVEETTAATTKAKPKPATTTAATTAATTKATTKVTEAPKPAEPSVITETEVNGSDKVVKYYNVSKDGTKTLSNTITYRTIAGKELVLTNIDEIRGYGRQNDYDANGNLLRYLTYNVKYGKRTLEILYDANGNVTKKTTYEYNDAGKKVRENYYDAADALTGYVTYEYIKANSGTKTKIVTYNANGQVLGSVVR